jgi:hypothetical protein
MRSAAILCLIFLAGALSSGQADGNRLRQATLSRPSPFCGGPERKQKLQSVWRYAVTIEVLLAYAKIVRCPILAKLNDI